MSARWLFDMLSPAGADARLTVLIFHRVLAEADALFPGEPDAARFQAQVEWIRSWFNVLSLPEAIERLRLGSLPARAAAVTFDDGYADNFTVALPILRRADVPATFFIAAGYLDGGRMWNDIVIDAVRKAEGAELDLRKFKLDRYPLNTLEDRRRSLDQILKKLKYLQPAERSSLVAELAASTKSASARHLMLSSEQVRALSAGGMTIGAHTVNHPILSRIGESEARAEMRESKERLETITGAKVTLFAYPNGKPGTDYTDTHVRLAREVGFEAACSTGWGAAKTGCDVFQIPRFTPWDRSRWRYALRIAQNMRYPIKLVQ
jgi:peptidoglycan/xylan/chitin deacetylase (PgdA/CDA1 family)